MIQANPANTIQVTARNWAMMGMDSSVLVSMAAAGRNSIPDRRQFGAQNRGCVHHYLYSGVILRFNHLHFGADTLLQGSAGQIVIGSSFSFPKRTEFCVHFGAERVNLGIYIVQFPLDF